MLGSGGWSGGRGGGLGVGGVVWGSGGWSGGGGDFFSKIEDIHLYRFSCWGGGSGGVMLWRGGGDGPGGGLFKKKIEDIHLYRFSCILVDIFAYYGSFAPKRHVDSYTSFNIKVFSVSALGQVDMEFYLPNHKI